jgi:hypothetical protein
MALSGQLSENVSVPQVQDDSSRRMRRRDRGRKPPTTEDGVKQLFVGIGFVLVALTIAFRMPGGQFWWFWMLIPAFSIIGNGVSQILRARKLEGAEHQQLPPPTPSPLIPQQDFNSLPARNTGELFPPPPSVTEGTTRHLGVEAPTRHFTAPVDSESPEK